MIYLIFVIGLMLGSFMGVIVKRLEKPKTIIAKPSHCEFCQRNLKPIDLIPLVSFAVNLGKCRYCHKKIGWFYPVVELNVALALAINYQVVFARTQNIWAVIFSSIIVFCLVLAIWTDINYMVIPDTVTSCILASALVLFFTFNFNFNQFLGAIIGSGFLAIMALAGRGKWMGWGDVKIMLGIGLWLGYPLIISQLLVSFMLGGFISALLLAFKIKKIKDIIPFGPFLIIATLIIYWLNFSIIKLWF